jgi:hypothetical protein
MMKTSTEARAANGDSGSNAKSVRPVWFIGSTKQAENLEWDKKSPAGSRETEEAESA